MNKIANQKDFKTFLFNLLKMDKYSSLVFEDVLSECKQSEEDPFMYLSKVLEINDIDMAKLSAKTSFIRYFDIGRVEQSHIKKIIDSEEYFEDLSDLNVIPVEVTKDTVVLSIYNPFNFDNKEDATLKIGKQGKNVKFVVSPYSEFIKVYDKVYEIEMNVGDISEEELSDVEEKEEEKEESISAEAVNEGPVVKFVKAVLLDAIKKGASDIHFEPYEKSFRIRLRIDGVLRTVNNPPLSSRTRVTARLKVMSGMDISEKRKPQDGRIKLKVSKTKDIDFRVNTLPTLYGEKVVLRILDPTSAQMGIDMLGYEKEQKELYLKNLDRPQGMILVTGPTGSGKTVSLYTGLNIVNTEDKNISTAEDPVEINLEGINQVNINLKQGLSFAEALRSFLRQDPDIIMVGEIRDLETAEIAIKAAQTGHLVLSTLHTNSAPETLTRLMNMGVAPFNIANSVSLIIAQRLARRLCGHCKLKDETPKERLIEDFGFMPEQAEGSNVFKPNVEGCDECTKGYKGRVGIYEVMPITKEISKIILEKGNALQISEAAQKDKIKNLRQSGVLKVLQGVTSLEEVNRVTTD